MDGAGSVAVTGSPVLVDAAGLADLVRSRAVTVLDVRWRLDRPDGRPAYEAGHVPGAVFVDLDRELAAPPTAGGGRHPLPAPGDLQPAARRWGVRAGRTVVVLDETGGMSAARAWWLLRAAGVPDVRLLDGGLDAWRDAGLPLETGDVQPEPGDAEFEHGRLPVVGAEDVGGFAGVLLDARAAERYRGEVEPVDARAGHIPGAVSAPTTANLDARGRFLPAAVLRRRFEELGVTAGKPVAVYCGSGVSAAHEIVALAVAGFEAALYPGSWSEWSNRPSAAVATGPGP